MTTKPRVLWNINASNFMELPGSFASSTTFGDRGYLFHATITDMQVPLFSTSIKTYGVLIREHNRRKKTSEYRFAIDESYHHVEYTKEKILREAIRKVKVNNIEPLDYYK